MDYVNDIPQSLKMVNGGFPLSVGIQTTVTATNPEENRIDCVGGFSAGNYGMAGMTQGLIMETTL